MRKSVRKKIEEVINQYSFEYNVPEVRREMINKLYENAKIPFKDLTTVNDVDNDTIRFQGYDAKTNKMVDLIVQPANIKYKEFYENL
jgi:hypothetical protein